MELSRMQHKQQWIGRYIVSTPTLPAVQQTVHTALFTEIKTTQRITQHINFYKSHRRITHTANYIRSKPNYVCLYLQRSVIFVNEN